MKIVMNPKTGEKRNECHKRSCFHPRSLFSFLCLAILVLTAFQTGCGKGQEKQGTVLYFSAHQDDETLEDFGGILQDLRDGLEVHVVLVSDGGASKVRKALQEEGHDLSREAFSAARDSEFRDALIALGVPDENIHFPENRLPDAELPEYAEEVKALLQYYVEQYPDAMVRTHAYEVEGVSSHKDHVTVGNAAVSLYESGSIKSLRLFVDPWVREDFESVTGIEVKKLPEKGLRNSERAAVSNAMDAYAFLDPEHGRYGIGARSVKSYWKQVRKEMTSYCFDYDGSK